MADQKDPKDIETGKESPEKAAVDKTAAETGAPVSDEIVSGAKPYDPISPDPEKTDGAAASVTESVAAMPVADAESTPKKGPSTALKALAAGLAGLLLIASLTAAIVFGLAWHSNKSKIDTQDEAKDAACAYAPTLAAYDFNHLDDYFKNVLAGATGDFKKEFDSSSKELKDVLVQSQAKTAVNDVQCATQSVDGTDHAKVIIVIGQNVTSVATKGQAQPNQLAMVASMDKTDGRWLVSKMDTPLVAPK